MNVRDELCELEARIAFIAAASGALSCLAPDDLAAFGSQKAWEGLYSLTLEIEEKLREVNSKNVS